MDSENQILETVSNVMSLTARLVLMLKQPVKLVLRDTNLTETYVSNVRSKIANYVQMIRPPAMNVKRDSIKITDSVLPVIQLDARNAQ